MTDNTDILLDYDLLRMLLNNLGDSGMDVHKESEALRRINRHHKKDAELANMFRELVK
jgi:hypothetical protein